MSRGGPDVTLGAEQREWIRSEIDRARRELAQSEHGPSKWRGIEVEPKRVGSCEASRSYGMDYFCGEPTKPGERFCGRHGGKTWRDLT